MTFVPVDQRGYAHPELLAETDWLAAHLEDPRLRVVDARGPQDYSAGHIPGALSLDGFGTGIPRAANRDMGSAEEFSQVAGELGIRKDMTVVVYDEPSQRIGMVAWTFLYYGHQDVRILDGGLEKWSGEGRPVSTAAVSYPIAAYAGKPADGIYCSLGHAKAGQAMSDFVFWDTRSLSEYEGTASSAAGALTRLGHIPGAIHLEWTDLFDPDTKTLKAAADLRQLLASKGITPEMEIATY